MSDNQSLSPRPKDGGDQTIRNILFAFALIVLTVYTLSAAAAQLIPIVLAVLIWFFINGIAHALRSIPVVRYILPMWLATVLSSLIVAGLAFLAVQLVLDNIAELSNGVGDFPPKAAAMVADIEETFGISFGVDVEQALRDLKVENLVNFGQVAVAVGDNLSSLFLMLLYVLFLLLDQPFYDAKINALCPDPVHQARVRAV